MSKHTLRTKRKYNNILNATIDIVGHTALEHITINQIKTKAKVSQVTIYNIFGSKDDLIVAAIVEKSDRAVK